MVTDQLKKDFNFCTA